MNDIRLELRKLDSLPTLSPVIQNILTTIDNPEHGAKELGEVISHDQSLSAYLLRLVNSAFYGHLRQITSISHAIVILGHSTVKNMALSVSAFNSEPEEGEPFLDRKRFWIHSLGVAYGCRIIHERVGRNGDGLDSGSIFLCGLLHDIGKVILDNCYNKEYAIALKRAKKEHRWIDEMEKDLFGVDHCEIGYYLASKWQLPDLLVNTIRYHHSPNESIPEHLKATMIVHLADDLCRKIKLGYGGDEGLPQVDESCMNKLGLSADMVATLCMNIDGKRQDIESFLNETGDG